MKKTGLKMMMVTIVALLVMGTGCPIAEDGGLPVDQYVNTSLLWTSVGDQLVDTPLSLAEDFDVFKLDPDGQDLWVNISAEAVGGGGPVGVEWTKAEVVYEMGDIWGDLNVITRVYTNDGDSSNDDDNMLFPLNGLGFRLVAADTMFWFSPIPFFGSALAFSFPYPFLPPLIKSADTNELGVEDGEKANITGDQWLKITPDVGMERIRVSVEFVAGGTETKELTFLLLIGPGFVPGPDPPFNQASADFTNTTSEVSVRLDTHGTPLPYLFWGMPEDTGLGFRVATVVGYEQGGVDHTLSSQPLPWSGSSLVINLASQIPAGVDQIKVWLALYRVIDVGPPEILEGPYWANLAWWTSTQNGAPFPPVLGPHEGYWLLDLGNTPPPGDAPVIVTHPQSVTRLVGESTTFNVTATGTPPLTYQWQHNGVNVGTNSTVYSIATVTLIYAGNYQCLVSNAYGNVMSNVAVLTIGTTPPPTDPLAEFTHTPSASTAGFRLYPGGLTLAEMVATASNLPGGSTFADVETIGVLFIFDSTPWGVFESDNATMSAGVFSSAITLDGAGVDYYDVAASFPLGSRNSVCVPFVTLTGDTTRYFINTSMVPGERNGTTMNQTDGQNYDWLPATP